MPENDGNKYIHDHQHGLNIDLRTMSYRRLWWALIINLIFLGIEIVGGILTNSLALLADAGHMLTDVAALSLALFVAGIAQKPATPDRTYGLLRAEVLGAFVNGAMLVFVVGLIFWEAWKRLGQTKEVDGPFMLLVAFFGLLANLGSASILAKGIKENVNLRGVFLHMIADALGSVAAMVAGVVILTTAWYPVDSIASMVIGLIILWSSWGFLKQTMNILLEATPEDIDFMEVKSALEDMEHIEKVHDLHIWNITSGMPVLTAHLYLASCCTEANHWQECLAEAQKILRERFGIEHTTLQVETSDTSGSTEYLFTEDN
jgi:cobalt-zinc-cadmium efflux system protein